MWDKYEDKSNFFWVNFVLLAVSATVLYLMLPWLKRVFRDSGVH
jgi:POT family proton-dependent oligopeptide transporter